MGWRLSATVHSTTDTSSPICGTSFQLGPYIKSHLHIWQLSNVATVLRRSNAVSPLTCRAASGAVSQAAWLAARTFLSSRSAKTPSVANTKRMWPSDRLRVFLDQLMESSFVSNTMSCALNEDHRRYAQYLEWIIAVTWLDVMFTWCKCKAAVNKCDRPTDIVHCLHWILSVYQKTLQI
jgi:hypothetical protein